jgi:hypothetical protein
MATSNCGDEFQFDIYVGCKTVFSISNLNYKCKDTHSNKTNAERFTNRPVLTSKKNRPTPTGVACCSKEVSTVRSWSFWITCWIESSRPRQQRKRSSAQSAQSDQHRETNGNQKAVQHRWTTWHGEVRFRRKPYNSLPSESGKSAFAKNEAPSHPENLLKGRRDPVLSAGSTISLSPYQPNAPASEFSNQQKSASSGTPAKGMLLKGTGLNETQGESWVRFYAWNCA